MASDPKYSGCDEEGEGESGGAIEEDSAKAWHAHIVPRMWGVYSLDIEAHFIVT
jgi:hypothetical protein